MCTSFYKKRVLPVNFNIDNNLKIKKDVFEGLTFACDKYSQTIPH